MDYSPLYSRVLRQTSVKNIKVNLIYIFLLLLIYIILMPNSIDGFYQASMISNAYLPDLGFEKSLSQSPTSIVAYIIMCNTLWSICHIDPLTTVRLFGFLSIVSIFFLYSMILEIIPGNRFIKESLKYGYPIMLMGLNTSIMMGYVISFTITLGFIIFLFFYKVLNDDMCYYKRKFFAIMICWFAIGLYWHSYHVAILLLVSAMVFTGYIYRIRITNNDAVDKKPIHIVLISTLLIIFVFLMIWSYMRVDMLSGILSNIVNNLNLGIISNLLNKGSTAGAFSYISQYPMGAIDTFRYVSYGFVYLFLFITFIISLWRLIVKKSFSSNYVIFIALLLADVAYQGLYFITTGSAAPLLLLIFTIPIFLILFNEYPAIKKIKWQSYITGVISILIVFSLVLTSATNMASYLTESPEKNIHLDSLQYGNRWLLNNNDGNAIMISDAHTIGHYAIFHNLNGQKVGNISVDSIGTGRYSELTKGIFVKESDVNSYVIIDHILYDEHLIFKSLQAWNKFEPLNPNHLRINPNINAVYYDGRVTIWQC